MAFVAALAPLLAQAAPYIAAAGTAYGAAQKGQEANYNAQVTEQEQRNSVNQAAGEEGIVRRASREALGRQAAAFGAAGVGYGGSSETSLDQSAVNQELDALNTRYKGAVTGWGYGAQSQMDKQEGQGAGLLAGAALLKGLGSRYSFSPTVKPNTTPETPSQLGGTIQTN